MPLSDYVPTSVKIDVITQNGKVADDRFKVTVAAPLITDPLIVRNYTYGGVFYMPDSSDSGTYYSYPDSNNAAASVYDSTFILPKYSGLTLVGSRVAVNVSVSIINQRTGERYERAEAVGLSNYISGRLSEPVFPTLTELRQFPWSYFPPSVGEIDFNTLTNNPLVKTQSSDLAVTYVTAINPDDKTLNTKGGLGSNIIEVGCENVGSYKYPTVWQDGSAVIYALCQSQTSAGAWIENGGVGSFMLGSESADDVGAMQVIGAQDMIASYGVGDLPPLDKLRIRAAVRSYLWGNVEAVDVGTIGVVSYFGPGYTNLQSQYTSDVKSKVIYGATLTTDDDPLNLNMTASVSGGNKTITLSCSNVLSENLSRVDFYYTDKDIVERKASVQGSSFSYTVPESVTTTAYAIAYGNANVYNESKASVKKINAASGEMAQPVIIRTEINEGFGLYVEIMPPSNAKFEYVLIVDGAYCETSKNAPQMVGSNSIGYTFSSSSVLDYTYSGVPHAVAVVAYNTITGKSSPISNVVDVSNTSSNYAAYFVSADANVERAIFETPRGLGFRASNVIISNSDIQAATAATYLNKDSASIVREVANTYTQRSVSRMVI